MPNLNPTKLILGVLTPFISAGAAWLCAAVAKYGVHLDPSGVNALGVAGATLAVAALLKLIHDVEKKRVAPPAPILPLDQGGLVDLGLAPANPAPATPSAPVADAPAASQTPSAV